MKLKNLKIYLLAVFGLFLLSLKTQAVLIDLGDSSLPSDFFTQSNSTRAIIQLAQENINYDNISLSAGENIKTILNNMRKNSKNVKKYMPITSADRNEIGALIQSIHLEFNGEEIDLFFRSHIQTIPLESPTNEKCFPDHHFQNLNGDTCFIPYLKKIIIGRPEINLNQTLWNHPDSIKIEEKWESIDDNNRICHQFVLLNLNTTFILFDFQSHPQN